MFQFTGMGAYIRFCASQYSAASLLQRLVEVKPGFDEFLRHCQSHPRVRGYPLSFFLLKPVKRVMDYPMLIEKILKNTDKTHPDYYYIEKALKLSKELCEQVNEGTRHKENTERLEWLQIHVDSAKNPELTLDEKLTFNSTTNLMGPRKFLHFGLLRKSKSSREIIAFLFNDFLLLTYPNKSVAPQFSFDKHHDLILKLYKKPIFLDEIKIVDMMMEEHQQKTDKAEFGIEMLLDNHDHGSKLLLFDASSIHDKKLWMQKLNNAIDQYQENVDLKKKSKYSGMTKMHIY